MTRHRSIAAAAVLAAGLGSATAQARNPVVGGAPMLPTKTIVENAGNAKDLSTLVAAVKAAGLDSTLSGPGPFTVFAPTNEAFKKLPDGTVDNLLKPENKAQLQAVLTYHVVPGALTTKELREKIKAGGGKATLKTVQGEELTVEGKGKTVEIVDTKGDRTHIAVPDVTQSNGVVQVIGTVLLP